MVAAVASPAANIGAAGIVVVSAPVVASIFSVFSGCRCDPKGRVAAERVLRCASATLQRPPPPQGTRRWGRRRPKEWAAGFRPRKYGRRSRSGRLARPSTARYRARASRRRRDGAPKSPAGSGSGSCFEVLPRDALAGAADGERGSAMPLSPRAARSWSKVLNKHSWHPRSLQGWTLRRHAGCMAARGRARE